MGMAGYVTHTRYMANPNITLVENMKERDHLEERCINDNWLLKLTL
jgi:hypothetical protein